MLKKSEKSDFFLLDILEYREYNQIILEYREQKEGQNAKGEISHTYRADVLYFDVP